MSIQLKKVFKELRFYLMAIICALVFRHEVLLHAEVPTPSMVPTVQSHDHILVNCFIYKFQEPEIGDIIAFYHREDPDSWFPAKYLKRIIACPGDTINLLDGKVYVNDDLLDESLYLADDIATYSHSWPLPYTLSEDEYFVMGDNRSISFDSRYWGPVSKKEIIGEAECIIFPFDKIGKLQ